ncbi:SDR family oxidoreductase [Cellulomonas sp. McL0617]|uniref:SDR family oxidoreductase n=1 Tax=Cellulomonas sp. McL0617 TaxID=3415675 RepID=UPI003CED2CDB
MSVVITGATGKLGRLVVESLLASGVPAADITATGRRIDRLADLGVAVALADFDEPTTLESAFAGADTVLLVSASEAGNRAAQHTRAIEAAQAAGVRRVVYTSAPKVSGDAWTLSPDHKATEDVLRASGLAWTILRNNWYHENYGPTLAQVAQTGVLLTSAGEGRVASAARADYAAAAAAVLTTDGHDGRTYELTGDVAWTSDEFAAAAAEVLGRAVVVQNVTTEEQKAILTGAGLDAGTIWFVTSIDADVRAGILGDATSDLRDLSGRPTTPLLDGLRALTPAAA